MSIQATLVFLCLIISSSLGQTTEDEDTTHAFDPEEQFLDIFPLTNDNFTSSVLRSSDAWIVLFHRGQLKKSWKSMAVNLRGVVWVGMVDTRDQADLMENMVTYNYTRIQSNANTLKHVQQNCIFTSNYLSSSVENNKNRSTS